MELNQETDPNNLINHTELKWQKLKLGKLYVGNVKVLFIIILQNYFLNHIRNHKKMLRREL